MSQPKFKIGDKVKIVDPKEGYKIGIVVKISTYNCLRVKFFNEEEERYFYFDKVTPLNGIELAVEKLKD